MIISKIRQLIGLETTEEKLERYEDIQKSFVESDKALDELAKDFFIEKSLFEKRMADPDNYLIRDKIKEKFDGFLKFHRQDINKAKKQFDSLNKKRDSIEKSISNHKYIRKEPGGKGGWNYIYVELNQNPNILDKQEKKALNTNIKDLQANISLKEKEVEELKNKIDNDFSNSGVYGSDKLKESIIYKVAFGRFLDEAGKNNVYFISDKSKSLRSDKLELLKLKSELNIDKLSKDEYEDVLRVILKPLKSERSSVKRLVGFRDVNKNITGSDYYIGTDAIYKSIDTKTSVTDKWEEIKLLGKHELSPKSSSEYVVTKDGVYRVSDHWGRCASCYWSLDRESNGWSIGFCKFEDFKLNGLSSSYSVLNPDYESKVTPLLNESYSNLDLIGNSFNITQSQKSKIDIIKDGLQSELNFIKENSNIIGKDGNSNSDYINENKNNLSKSENEEIEKSLKHHKFLRIEIDHNGNKKYIYDEPEQKIEKEEVKQNFDSKKIKDYAERIIKGEEHLNRLSPEEEQGRIRGGRANVEATIILGTSKTTDGEVHGREEQLKVLEDYSKKAGLWVEDYKEIYHDFLDRATESEVYYENGFVFKINNFSQHEDIAEMFDRVAIQNTLFNNETSYEVIGFTKRDGEVNVILKQPFIVMKEDDNGDVIRPTKEELTSEMEKMGFEDYGGNMYINKDYLVEDLHSKNFCFTRGGNIAFIDPVIRVNLRDEGYGGNRELGKIEFPIQKSLDSYFKIKKSFHQRNISLDTFNTIIKGITKQEQTKYADFIVLNEKNQLLLLKRSSWEDNNAGAWVLPGGHVDPGEDFETAAKRELVEEAGISADECSNVGSYEDDKVHIEYYQTTVDSWEKQPVLQWEEARDFKWVPLNEIKDETMIFNMAENVMRILGLVNRHKEIIRKAILEGIIPLEQVIEKSSKITSKLIKKKKLITRGGKTFLTTIYVKSDTDEEVSVIDEKEVDYSSIIKDIKVGDEFYASTSRIKGDFVLENIFLEKGREPYFTVLVEGKVKCIMVKNLTFFRKKDSTILAPKTGATIPSLSELTLKKSLGGSSDVKLMADKDGKLFAVKKPHKLGDENQLKKEKTVNDIYNGFGFKTTESELKDGVLISRYIDGAVELNTLSKSEAPSVYEKIKEGFVLDCLLANWDVLGSGKDNILLKSGEIYRVDNGGSLDQRAKGGVKSYSEIVGEIMSMRDHEPGKYVYSSVTEEDIKKQIEFIDKNRSHFDQIKKLTGGDKLFNTTLKRLEWLKKEYKIGVPVAPTAPTPPKKVLRPDMPSLVTQDYFDSKWNDVNISGNKGLKEAIKDQILKVEKVNESDYSSLAKKHGKTVEQIKQDFQTWVEGCVAKSKGYIVAHSSGSKSKGVVGLVLSEGRFKTQFETGTSEGALSSVSRGQTELNYFGFDKSKDGPDMRPIYGFFTDINHGILNKSKTIPPPREVSQYGDVCFEVKDSKFKKDATITFRDSLSSYFDMAATPASNPHFTSISPSETSYDNLKRMYDGSIDSGGAGYSYVESQYHNKLSLTDIEKIHIAYASYNGDMPKLSKVINEISEAVSKSGQHTKIEIF